MGFFDTAPGMSCVWLVGLVFSWIRGRSRVSLGDIEERYISYDRFGNGKSEGG